MLNSPSYFSRLTLYDPSAENDVIEQLKWFIENGGIMVSVNPVSSKNHLDPQGKSKVFVDKFSSAWAMLS